MIPHTVEILCGLFEFSTALFFNLIPGTQIQITIHEEMAFMWLPVI